jgi:hypothetical protein
MVKAACERSAPRHAWHGSRYLTVRPMPVLPRGMSDALSTRMAKVVGLALLVMGCGGNLDPLGGGGGDPSLLHAAGSACTSLTSSVTDFDAGPACSGQSFSTTDSTCKAWVEQTLPPNWPTANECIAGRCAITTTLSAFPACKTGSAGDEYCTAWASQFVRGNGTPKQRCEGFESNNVNGQCFNADFACGTNGCSLEQICVERNGVSTCEDPCK